MDVLVTGGAGFIGSNLCRRLRAEPSVGRVVAFDDLSSGFESNIRGVDGVEFVSGSILDTEVLGPLVAGVGAVVHLAARPSVPRSVAEPGRSYLVNVQGTFNVLEAVRTTNDQAHVIFASSSSVYGANPELPKHEGLATIPRSPYAASKLAGEGFVVAYGQSYGIATLPFRFFNVYGPRQMAGHAYAAVVPAFLRAALRAEALPVHGDGTQTRDFTAVGTVADVITDAIVRRVSSPAAVNLAFGSRHSLSDLVAMLANQLGTTLTTETLPLRVGDVPHSQAANERLRSLFPDVIPVNLHDGLAKTVTWAQAEPDFVS